MPSTSKWSNEGRIPTTDCPWTKLGYDRRKSNNESCESSDTKDPDVDFERPVNQAEKENVDWGLPLDLRRMMEQEEREMELHQ